METYYKYFNYDRKELKLADYMNWEMKDLREAYAIKMEKLIKFITLIDSILVSEPEVIATNIMDRFLKMELPQGDDPKPSNGGVRMGYHGDYMPTCNVCELAVDREQRCLFSGIHARVEKDVWEHKRENNKKAIILMDAAYATYMEVLDSLSDEHKLLIRLQD